MKNIRPWSSDGWNSMRSWNERAHTCRNGGLTYLAAEAGM
jgi:hypothetical protein